MSKRLLVYLLSSFSFINNVYSVNNIYSVTSIANSEIEEITQRSSEINTEEVTEFLETQFLEETAKSKCRSTISWGEEIHTQTKKETNISTTTPWNIYLFISFSVPTETWKHYSSILERLGGTFILRGLPKNSFPLLSHKIAALREKGVTASIIIDPEAFEKYQISHAPTLILESGSNFDKVEGNFTFDAALTIIESGGDLSHIAKTLKQQLREGE